MAPDFHSLCQKTIEIPFHYFASQKKQTKNGKVGAVCFSRIVRTVRIECDQGQGRKAKGLAPNLHISVKE